VLEDLTGGVEVPTREQSTLNFTVSPNPFSGNAEFVLNIPDNAGVIEFSIYNVSGTLIKSFSLDRVASSQINLSWDGIGNNGEKCTSGTYIGILKAGEERLFKGKILLIK